ncbi:MAG: hypothetical protein ACYSWQ_20650 [Planctomycetota bacterium]
MGALRTNSVGQAPPYTTGGFWSMEATERDGYGEQTPDRHGGTYTTTKRFALALVAFAVLLLLLLLVWTRRDSDVNSVLSRAGFANLPESARDVRVDSQGSVFGRRVTLVSFGADPADMRHFVETSPTGSPELRGVWDIRFNAVDYPSWWLRGGEPFRQRTYFVRSGRFSGVATVDSDTHTIWIQLIYESPLLTRIKRYVQFI